MRSLRLTTFTRQMVIHLMPLLYLTLVVVSNIPEIGAEEVTRNPLRLSSFLRNLTRTTTTELPLVNEVTTWRPKSVRSIVDRRGKANEGAAGVNSSSATLEHAASSPVRLRINYRRSKPSPTPTRSTPSTIAGIDKENKRKPEELIRHALINHTLEHGGEEDLDKLVFSTLPQGSKLILRTVRIIRTDENGEPVDTVESQQPTYWDITLANATDKIVDNEEEGVTDEDDSEDEEEDEEEDIAPKTVNNTGRVIGARGVSERKRISIGNGTAGGRKKSDLLSSGSHSAANYQLQNDYGGVGREKEHGKTHYHGNTHGKTHKETYTLTDGKDVKPYHGTEKGLNDYAHGGGYDNKDQGERFKSSKRKNKGRKVTGFKRVYHKEEFQRTEHFYDDEEAKKIAESFGLTEAKQSNEHGTKGDKRKYQGVRTDYLDGKKHENEHGTHDGHDKGQHNTYKDTEKHNHHSNYGKSMSHHHNGGTSPHHQQHGEGYHDQQYHHGQHQQQHQPHQEQHQQYDDYHPNHNYHTSYSTPKKKTISRPPSSINDQLGDGRTGLTGSAPPHYSAAAIVSAPITTSFTVTEYSPASLDDAASTPNPTVVSTVENSIQTYAPERLMYKLPQNNHSHTSDYSDYTKGNVTDYDDHHYDTDYDHDDRILSKHRSNSDRGREPREKKIFFSPKHRDVNANEDDEESDDDKYTLKNFQSVPLNAVPYQVQYPARGITNAYNASRDHSGSGDDNDAGIEDHTPFAPNFGPHQQVLHHQHPHQQQPNGYIQPGILTHQIISHNKQPVGRHPAWRWHRRRQKRPRPPPHIDPTLLPIGPQSQPQPSAFPHLAAIPFRHASAYHRLGHRLRYPLPRPRRPFYEMSTRKSDDGISDDKENTTEPSSATNSSDKDEEDHTAHYFNHNHRYAKNYLTSTTHPLAPSGGGGVRNTLLDSNPGVYSTIIKVLPATMLKMNGSTSTTKRPKTFADMISITTAFPNLLPQPQQHFPQQIRPFIPRGRWLTFNMNPGTAHHPPPFNSPPMRMPNIMRGIRSGMLRPFTRAILPMHPHPHQPPALMVASPTVSAESQGMQLQKLPSSQPYLSAFPRPPQPHFPQLQISYPPGFRQYGGPLFNGILPLGSKDYVKTVAPPAGFLMSTPATAVHEKKPKFYYTLNANSTNSSDIKADKIGAAGNGTSSDSEGGKSLYNQPTLKVSAVTSNSKISVVSSPTEEGSSVPQGDSPMARKQTQAAPFIHGLMDSVSGFFGKMG